MQRVDRPDLTCVLQWYGMGKEVAIECYGMYHILVSRIYLNTGIAYEDHRQYELAYDHFKQSYLINVQVGAQGEGGGSGSTNVLVG